ncbi:hypothetical protein [Microcoleus vaginatus]|uniref:hypothetical protein n=1 Tax=Microcoleus vaginatus TaxID=119532 RepID=UPI0032AE5C7F
MSTPDRRLGFTYIQEGQAHEKSLRFSFVDEYTAVLTNPICEDSGVKVEVNFDHTVINYLKQIDGIKSDYYFEFREKMIWFISPLPVGNYSGNPFGFVSGDMIYNGSKIICTNTILNPALENIPT